MFIDTTKRSKGHVVVFADARGSYGEVVNTQFGRTYRDVQTACTRAYTLAQKGITGVMVKNLNTGWMRTYSL